MARFPDFYHLQGGPGAIKNGRPADQVDLPIGLYHPVFGNFLNNLENPDPTQPTSASLCASTKKFFAVSQDIYKIEELRLAEIDKELGSLIGEPFLVSKKLGVLPGGMITGHGGAACIFMEMKNEVGAGGSDPSIQAAIAFSKFWGNDSVRTK